MPADPTADLCQCRHSRGLHHAAEDACIEAGCGCRAYRPIGRPASSARVSRIGDTFGPSGSAKAQKPYRNGVVIWNDSGSSGRGFDYTAKIAVRDGRIVGVYFNEYMRRRAEVVHPHFLSPIDVHEEWERDFRGERVVTRTALSKWIEAVKGL